MKHILTFTIALMPIATMPACDSPDDEAELQALDIEDDKADEGVERLPSGAPAAEASRRALIPPGKAPRWSPAALA